LLQLYKTIGNDIGISGIIYKSQ